MKKVVRLTESDLLRVVKRVLKEEYTPEKESEYYKLTLQRDFIKSQLDSLSKRYEEISERLNKIELLYHPKLIISFVKGKRGEKGDRYSGRIMIPNKYRMNPKSENERFYSIVSSPKNASEYTGKDDPKLIKDLTNEFRKKFSNPKWLDLLNFNPDDILFDKNIN